MWCKEEGLIKSCCGPVEHVSHRTGISQNANIPARATCEQAPRWLCLVCEPKHRRALR